MPTLDQVSDRIRQEAALTSFALACRHAENGEELTLIIHEFQTRQRTREYIIWNEAIDVYAGRLLHSYNPPTEELKIDFNVAQLDAAFILKRAVREDANANY